MSEREHYRRRDKRLSYDIDERRDPESIMKTYPNISYATESHLPIVAFDKLSGSNVRAKWTSKKDWHKFGTPPQVGRYVGSDLRHRSPRHHDWVRGSS